MAFVIRPAPIHAFPEPPGAVCWASGLPGRGQQRHPHERAHSDRAAKTGLFGLTMSLAQETARKGITVNSVAPGYVSTDMVAAVPQAALKEVIAKIPGGPL